MSRRWLLAAVFGFALLAWQMGNSALSSDPPAQSSGGGTCGQFGTQVDFVSTPSEAGRRALKEEKLAFVLHVSGLFEDPKLT